MSGKEPEQQVSSTAKDDSEASPLKATGGLGDPRTVRTRSRHRLPSILSGLYRRYSDTVDHDVAQRYAHALTFTEGVFRFFAYISMANVIAVEGEHDEILKQLRRLSSSSMGTYGELNHWAQKRLKLEASPAFCPELSELILSDFWQSLTREVIPLRNRYAHGPMIIEDEERFLELEPYVEGLITRIQWLAHYRLGSFTNGKYQ